MTQEARLDTPSQKRQEPSALHAYRQLRELISQGMVAPGERLASERELGGKLGISRMTLRHALKALEEDGLLRSAPGRGWYVVDDMLSEPPNELLSFHEMARARGLTATSRVLEKTQRPATLDEAEALQTAPGTEVLDLERLRMLDGLPVLVDRTCLLLTSQSRLPGLDFSAVSLYEVLEEESGLRASRCQYTVQAQAADERVAQLLGLSTGAPVLKGWVRTFDQRDRPLHIGQVVYRGDRYRFKAELVRPRGGAVERSEQR